MNITIDILGTPLAFNVRKYRWDAEILSSIFKEYRHAFSLNLKDSIIIDVGAHIGGFSKIASIIYPQAKIYSYEPDPENFFLLKKNLSKTRNCTLYNVGVSGKEKSGKLQRHLLDPAMYKVVWTNEKTNNCLDVPCIPINEILDRFNEIGILKLDCEGSELSFLPHITKKNKEKIQYLTGEVHPREKSVYGNKSHHEDAELIREFFPEFRFLIDNLFFFGWK